MFFVRSRVVMNLLNAEAVNVDVLGSGQVRVARHDDVNRLDELGDDILQHDDMFTK